MGAAVVGAAAALRAIQTNGYPDLATHPGVPGVARVPPKQESILYTVVSPYQSLQLPERSIPALFNASLRFRLRNADYREVTEVNDTTAGRDLARLVEAGMLAAKGERRGRFYVATSKLMALDESIRAERKPVEDPFETPPGETLGL